MYAFGAMLSFTIAHAAVVRLRLAEPDRERPYRGPGTLRIRGRELPLFALLGGTGTGLAWLTVTVLHLDVAAAGLGWLALGVGLYAIYRRGQGLDLTTTTQRGGPEAGRRPRGGVRVGARRLRRARITCPSCWRPRSASPRGAAAASTCS